MAYRVNAGAVSSASWVVDPVQGGGRLVGEVCHMVDTLVDLVGAPVMSVYAQPASKGGDDVILTLQFEDGSIGTIVYASGGDRSLPKEYLEVLGAGRAAVLDDFRTVRLYAGGSERRAEVRPTSRVSAQAAVGRTSPDRLRPGTRQAVSTQISWFSAAFLGGRVARQDKGHAAELAAFVDAVRHGGPSPLDPEVAAHVTRVTFAAVQSARAGEPVSV
jgi:predicted dehydrogenase